MKRLFALIFCLAIAAPAFAQTPCPCPEKKEPPPLPALTGGLGFGLGINSGNTDTTNFNFTLGLKYDPKTQNVVKLDGYYLYGKTNGLTTAQKSNVVLRDEYSFSERFFAFAEVGYLYDRFSGITYLITPIVGAGYKVVKTKEISLAFDGGVGLALEQDAGLPSHTSGALRAGESFEWALSAWAKLAQNAHGLWKMDDTQNYYFHFDVGVVSPLSKALELRVAYLTDYKNKPEPATLKKTDRSFLAVVGYKF